MGLKLALPPRGTNPRLGPQGLGAPSQATVTWTCGDLELGSDTGRELSASLSVT
jgi:hypothetical protein